MTEQSPIRFDLEWAVPLEPGLPTFVTLIDHEAGHAELHTGEGADEADALMNLYERLQQTDAGSAALVSCGERMCGGLIWRDP